MGLSGKGDIFYILHRTVEAKISRNLSSLIVHFLHQEYKKSEGELGNDARRTKNKGIETLTRAEHQDNTGWGYDRRQVSIAIFSSTDIFTKQSVGSASFSLRTT